jgi:hypothetical protein
MIIKIEGNCQYEDCDKPATCIAQGRSYSWSKGHDLGLYCEHHADIVSDENSPEYQVDCPNCGCLFGVN